MKKLIFAIVILFLTGCETAYKSYEGASAAELSVSAKFLDGERPPAGYWVVGVSELDPDCKTWRELGDLKSWTSEKFKIEPGKLLSFFIYYGNTTTQTNYRESQINTTSSSSSLGLVPEKNHRYLLSLETSEKEGTFKSQIFDDTNGHVLLPNVKVIDLCYRRK